ncbi:hypothetical protein Hanom_Chr03g00194561 [Helianthus anomalus]
MAEVEGRPPTTVSYGNRGGATPYDKDSNTARGWVFAQWNSGGLGYDGMWRLRV